MNLKRSQTQALSSAYLQEQVTLVQLLGLAKFGPQGTLPIGSGRLKTPMCIAAGSRTG